MSLLPGEFCHPVSQAVCDGPDPGVIRFSRQLEIQRVGQAIKRVEKETNVKEFSNGLFADSGTDDLSRVFRSEFLGLESDLLEKAESCLEICRDRCRSPVFENPLDQAFIDFFRRNCGVSAGSETARVNF